MVPKLPQPSPEGSRVLPAVRQTLALSGMWLRGAFSFQLSYIGDLPGVCTPWPTPCA